MAPFPGDLIEIPLFGTIAHEDKMVIAVKLAVAIIDHLDGNRHQIQWPGQRIVNGPRISTVTIQVELTGIHISWVQTQAGHHIDIDFVKPGAHGGQLEPLAFRECTVLRPIVGKLGRGAPAQRDEET